MTNSDIFDYSLIAAGILAITVFVVGAIRRQGTAYLRISKIMAGVTLSVLAGYSWALISLGIGFTITGADWSGRSSTWLSELMFRQAMPCGIAVATLGVFLAIRGYFRKPSNIQNQNAEQAVPPNA